MTSTIRFWIMLPAFVTIASTAFASPSTLLPSNISDVIEKGAEQTSLKGAIGMAWRIEDREARDSVGEDKASAGWSFVEIGLETGSMWNIQIGAGAVGVQKLWTSGAFDNDDPDDELFDTDVWLENHDAYWTEGYVKYSVPSKSTSFLLGRADDKKFGKPVSGDGDFYQGLGITVDTIPHVKIRAHAVNEWTNNASWSWDFDGIQDGWTNLTDESGYASAPGEDAGRVAYTLMVESEIVEDALWFNPYVQHQDDVGTGYGTSLRIQKTFDSVTLGMKASYAYFDEKTPNDLWPDDENMDQYKLNPYANFETKDWRFEAGFGYYRISNDIAPFNSKAEGGDDFEDLFIWDEFDPMEEDLAKYGEHPNNETWFVHAGADWGPFSLEAIYGWCNHAVIENGSSHDGEATELDVYLTAAITESIVAELVFVSLDDDYEADGDRSRNYFAGSIAYEF